MTHTLSSDAADTVNYNRQFSGPCRRKLKLQFNSRNLNFFRDKPVMNAIVSLSRIQGRAELVVATNFELLGIV